MSAAQDNSIRDFLSFVADADDICLRAHGMIKKIGHYYKYYLTTLERCVAAAALRLREMTIILSLAVAHARG
jgi:hypothetical protein